MRHLIEQSVVRAGSLREAHERRARRRVDMRGETRQDLQPQIVAPRIRRIVRRIVAHLDAMRRAVSDKLLLRAGEQGTHDIARARPHAHEAVQPRAAQDMLQHRLRLIVCMMRDSDHLSAYMRLYTTQKSVAQFACRRFQRHPALFRILRHIRRLHAAGNALRSAECSDIVRILARRLAANAVLEMRDMHGKRQPLLQMHQQIEQRHRVCAARDGDHDGRAMRQKSMLLAKSQDLIQHEILPSAAVRQALYYSSPVRLSRP